MVYNPLAMYSCIPRNGDETLWDVFNPKKELLGVWQRLGNNWHFSGNLAFFSYDDVWYITDIGASLIKYGGAPKLDVVEIVEDERPDW